MKLRYVFCFVLVYSGCSYANYPIRYMFRDGFVSDNKGNLLLIHQEANIDKNGFHFKTLGEHSDKKDKAKNWNFDWNLYDFSGKRIIRPINK